MTQHQSPSVTKILARRVIYEGREYGLTLVEVCGGNVTLTPFERETAATVYYSGTLRILPGPVLIKE